MDQAQTIAGGQALEVAVVDHRVLLVPHQEEYSETCSNCSVGVMGTTVVQAQVEITIILHRVRIRQGTISRVHLGRPTTIASIATAHNSSSVAHVSTFLEGGMIWRLTDTAYPTPHNHIRMFM